MTDNSNPIVPQTTAIAGRGTNGRFAKGNKAARGNPNNIKAQKLRNAMLRTVGQKDIHDIIRAQIDVAIKGDTAAARLVLEMALGKPGVTVRVDTETTAASIEERRESIGRFFGLNLETADNLELPNP